MWNYIIYKPNKDVVKEYLTKESIEKMDGLENPVAFVKINSEKGWLNFEFVYLTLNKNKLSLKKFTNLFVAEIIDLEKEVDKKIVDKNSIVFIEEKNLIKKVEEEWKRGEVDEVYFFDYSSYSKKDISQKQKTNSLLDEVKILRRKLNPNIQFVNKKFFNEVSAFKEQDFTRIKLDYSLLPLNVILKEKSFVKNLIEKLLSTENSCNNDEYSVFFTFNFLSNILKHQYPTEKSLVKNIDDWTKNESVTSYTILINTDYSDDYSVDDWAHHYITIIDNTFFNKSDF
jgi:hypothetical protein